MRGRYACECVCMSESEIAMIVGSRESATMKAKVRLDAFVCRVRLDTAGAAGAALPVGAAAYERW